MEVLGILMVFAALGVQMIIEDYIPLASGRLVLVMAARTVFIIASLLGVVAVGLVMGWI